MKHLKEYMTVPREKFGELRPQWDWRIFPDLVAQDRFFAQTLIERLRRANEKSQDLAVVLPTGPIDFSEFVQSVNRERVSLNNLHVFMMDEYCRDRHTPIEEDHPLSFRRHIRSVLHDSVDEELRIPRGQLRFPDPSDPESFDGLIEEMGGIDIMFSGFGITGHMAFNDPPEDEEHCTVEEVANSTTRVVSLAPETIAQNAIGGTRGLVELVPPLAVTIGMKQMLSSDEIHLYLLRKWHSGVFRRCLFGPITPRVPGSFIQEHERVTVCMPEYVAEKPEVVVQLDI